MDTIRMKRDDLLAILKENRDKHESEYLEALAGWGDKALAALTAAKKAAKEAVRENTPGDIRTDPLKDLPKPTNYIKSYDDAIARIEHDIRPEVELDDRQFSAWVQDDWQWRGAFIGTASLYNNGSI